MIRDLYVGEPVALERLRTPSPKDSKIRNPKKSRENQETLSRKSPENQDFFLFFNLLKIRKFSPENSKIKEIYAFSESGSQAEGGSTSRRGRNPMCEHNVRTAHCLAYGRPRESKRITTPHFILQFA